jgi:hypothetical protein
MKLKTGILILTIILFGKNIVNAFDYRYNGSCVYWNAGATGEWMNQNNWTDSSPTPDYLVPGWYAGNPNNTQWTTNNGFADIEYGVVNVGAASHPDATVNRLYLGSVGSGPILNVSGGSIAFNRFIMSYSLGETSTVNLSGGTMTFLNEGDWTFLGYGGSAIFNMSGGTLNGGRIRLASGNGSANPAGNAYLNISGGTFSITGYIDFISGGSTSTAGGASILEVSGSSASITAYGLSVAKGKNNQLIFDLDAYGVSDITIYGGDASLNDATIIINSLPGFNGHAGDTFDLVTLLPGSTKTLSWNGTLVNNITGLDFNYAIVTEDGHQILRLTAIPEPTTLVLLGYGVLTLIRKRT